MSVELHGYWRSGTSYRVRIALAFKGVGYEQVTHDLRVGAHRDSAYAEINHQGLVPSVRSGGLVFTQSIAILEWLEETFPDPPLLPDGKDHRAIVRAMAGIIACDIHPLNNLRVLDRLRQTTSLNTKEVNLWASKWICDGFAALDSLIERHGMGFAFGDRMTIADCCLVPQIYSAERFGVDVSRYTALYAAGEKACAIPAVVQAHPDLQPDADRTASLCRDTAIPP